MNTKELAKERILNEIAEGLADVEAGRTIPARALFKHLQNDEVRASEIFIRVSKRLVKKYASFEDDYLYLIANLENNPAQAVDLGSGLKKVRISQNKIY